MNSLWKRSLILFLLVSPLPGADFDSRVIVRETRGTVLIEDLIFRTEQRTYTSAYRVCPAETVGQRPGILFVHWYDPEQHDSNRSQFLDEASELAAKGACGLLVETMWSQPDWFRSRDPSKDRSATERQRDRLRDALDFLLSGPDIDAQRIAFVGHDFGGMFGALLAATETRVRAWALQAATPRWHEWYLLGRRLEGAERDAVAAATADLDPLSKISSARGSFLFQFALNDEYVPKNRAEEFFSAAPNPRKLLWYDAGHGLNSKARIERVSWLVEILKLK